MAKIGEIVVTMEKGDSLKPVSIGASLHGLVGGISFGGASLWTGTGCNVVLEDCDRLMEVVVKLKALLRERINEIGIEASKPEEEKEPSAEEVFPGIG